MKRGRKAGELAKMEPLYEEENVETMELKEVERIEDGANEEGIKETAEEEKAKKKRRKKKIRRTRKKHRRC